MIYSLKPGCYTHSTSDEFSACLQTKVHKNDERRHVNVTAGKDNAAYFRCGLKFQVYKTMCKV